MMLFALDDNLVVWLMINVILNISPCKIRGAMKLLCTGVELWVDGLLCVK